MVRFVRDSQLAIVASVEREGTGKLFETRRSGKSPKIPDQEQTEDEGQINGVQDQHLMKNEKKRITSMRNGSISL